MLSPAQWQSYKNIINNANASFNNDVITWKRITIGLQRYGEDTKGNETTEDISLKCLIAYNIFRTWPMTVETTAGAIDMESMTMILNIKYLKDLGYLSPEGNFAFNPGRDIFIHQGQEYRSAGETPVAQAGDEPLLIYIILSRNKTLTGKNKY